MAEENLLWHFGHCSRAKAARGAGAGLKAESPVLPVEC
jgi:hypothetical protein